MNHFRKLQIFDYLKSAGFLKSDYLPRERKLPQMTFISQFLVYIGHFWTCSSFAERVATGR